MESRRLLTMSKKSRKRKASDLECCSPTISQTACPTKKRRLTLRGECESIRGSQSISDSLCTDPLSTPFDSQCSINSGHSTPRHENNTISAQDVPSVILQHILSFNTPHELSVCSGVNHFYRIQSEIMWHRLPHCTISPQFFPSLIGDDYDSQIEYNPMRHPHRSHSTLRMIEHKLSQCAHLTSLTIQRTMMSGSMLQCLLRNTRHLTQLTLGVFLFSVSFLSLRLNQ